MSIAFAQNSDFLTRYDYRIASQLVLDDGTVASQASLLTDSVVTASLEDASGRILMSALRGERYSEADLYGLTGISQDFLIRLTCDIALYYLVLRRGLPVENYPQIKNALELLKELEAGTIIFNVASVAASGIAAWIPIDIQTVVNENFLRDNVRYFPTRRWTIPQLGG